MKAKETIWNMFECEHGARWTAVKGGYCDEPVGECGFAGCFDGHHTFKLVGETTDRTNAHVWFRRPTIHQEVCGHVKEGINENSSYFAGEFWKIFNSKSSASWGWAEPLRFKGLVIVWLTFSPPSKGEHSYTYFDYMTINEFEAGEETE